MCSEFGKFLYSIHKIIANAKVQTFFWHSVYIRVCVYMCKCVTTYNVCVRVSGTIVIITLLHVLKILCMHVNVRVI